MFGRDYWVSDLDINVFQRDPDFRRLIINHAFFAADENDCKLRTLDPWADIGTIDKVYGGQYDSLNGILGGYLTLKKRYGTDFIVS